MPHLRTRNLLPSFKKNMKFWPVVALLGPRQCGKSTFLRELAFNKGGSTYRTFDTSSQRRLALQNPEIYLKNVDTYPLIIDEAHKVPDVFDEIKALVDTKRMPGRFVLSGSVEFSRKTGVRESLTGRCATMRMDSLTISETHSKKALSIKDVLLHLETGGMPGVFAIRDINQRHSYWNEWIETLCERDLKVISGGRLSGDLAHEVLETIALVEFPNVTNIAKKIGIDTRRVQNHIDALISLFVIRSTSSSESSIGKPLYSIFDCGLASHLGASTSKKWQTFFLHEYTNQNLFKGEKPKHLKFYKSKRGSYIDFVDTSKNFHAFCESIIPSKRNLMTYRAAIKANPNSKVFVYCPTDDTKETIEPNIYRVPWMSQNFGTLKNTEINLLPYKI